MKNYNWSYKLLPFRIQTAQPKNINNTRKPTEKHNEDHTEKHNEDHTKSCKDITKQKWEMQLKPEKSSPRGLGKYQLTNPSRKLNRRFNRNEHNSPQGIIFLFSLLLLFFSFNKKQHFSLKQLKRLNAHCCKI